MYRIRDFAHPFAETPLLSELWGTGGLEPIQEYHTLITSFLDRSTALFHKRRILEHHIYKKNWQARKLAIAN